MPACNLKTGRLNQARVYKHCGRRRIVSISRRSAAISHLRHQDHVFVGVFGTRISVGLYIREFRKKMTSGGTFRGEFRACPRSKIQVHFVRCAVEPVGAKLTCPDAGSCHRLRSRSKNGGTIAIVIAILLKQQHRIRRVDNYTVNHRHK